jgi:hypothetical protein
MKSATAFVSIRKSSTEITTVEKLIAAFASVCGATAVTHRSVRWFERQTIVSRRSGLLRGQIIRAEGPVAYQPGATPQVRGNPHHQGLKARHINREFHATSDIAPCGWVGLSALGFIFPSIPGALPQAGMRTHLRCCKPSTVCELDTTTVNNVTEFQTHKEYLSVHQEDDRQVKQPLDFYKATRQLLHPNKGNKSVISNAYHRFQRCGDDEESTNR